MKIEDFIRENRQEFEQGDLPAGHMLRFEQKLPGKQRKLSGYHWYSGVAACLVLAIGLELLWKLEAPRECELLCQEIHKVKMYYSMKVSDEAGRIRSLAASSPEKEVYLREVDGILSENESFEKEIPAFPESEITINILAQHYQSSLNSLEYMAGQLEQKSY